ncbi:hypothetical protein LARV_00500 [Longilinea arvoryzae]|uniref:Right handed beta helix domain-containing protein n=1 Tax=Longilinea arvoryzae TaxID=360412 RepID=A0A0S7B6F9_9CHLR|nr:right-handed parallel beta-helix repeat-containing protein [Longilinea arvoryzae]GAP12764.1 hypothetical protein LARV_00500 [Longilinea arvoryzae]
MRSLLFKIGMTICTGAILLALLTGCAATASSTAAATTPTQTTAAATSAATQSVPAAPPAGAPADGPGGAPGNAPGGAPGGGAASVDTGTGAYTLADGEALNGGTYTSTNADENALRAEGDVTASLNDVTVEKSAGVASSSDASSFYGLNAAILALDTATLNITGGTVTASAEGANGVFAYDGSTIHIQDTTINVSGGNAGGIEVSGGATLTATNLTVNSTVKAAIRSDRGGGTLTVDGGTYTTSGSSGAPAIYSTANITANNATLTANDSEAVVVEGFNSVTLNDCTVTGNMSGTYGQASGENIHNVMLYQSMSGDAETGTSSFTMTGGTLVSKNGDMFYVTNTNSVITLSGVDLTLADGAYLLRVSGNDGSRGWGTAGSNGGNATFDLSGQTLSGDIFVDAISTLDMKISNSSAFTGAINPDGTQASSLSVTLDSTSTWTLTADSYVSAFNGSMDNVVTNGHTLYVNGSAIN